MPITSSAKRALRITRRRTIFNLKVKEKMKAAVKKVKNKKTKKGLATAFSLIDRAAKKNVIHKNKAARLKNRLSSL